LNQKRLGLYLLPLFLLVVGCSGGTGIKSEGGLFSARGEGGLLNARSDGSRSREQGESGGDWDIPARVAGVEIKEREFDIPVDYTPEVRFWMEYFTGRGRRHFAVYLERMAKFEPIILPRLREAELPEDLIYLALIESGFATSATSHAGAVGPWQFIRSTGRMYGLEQDWWRDERRDPVKSTEAAIEYLSRLYEEFGDWKLACSAYNSGELRIRRAISRLGTKDYWRIARDRKALRQETKDYVPKMMAAAIIGKNAEAFGFQKFPADSVWTQVTEVKLPKAENLRTIAQHAGIDRATLLELNPELLRCCTPPQRAAYSIKVPRGESAAQLLAAVESGEVGRMASFKRHVVKRGDTLSSIAKRNGVPSHAILAMNEVRSSQRLKPGTELVIPDSGGVAYRSDRQVASERPRARKSRRASEAKSAAEGRSLSYVVRKGDTLYGISRRYDVRVEEIRRWNPSSQTKNLRPGSRIRLYVRNDY
jgi:membrane-bound lytic murein transglycosylase D